MARASFNDTLLPLGAPCSPPAALFGATPVLCERWPRGRGPILCASRALVGPSLPPSRENRELQEASYFSRPLAEKKKTMGVAWHKFRRSSWCGLRGETGGRGALQQARAVAWPGAKLGFWSLTCGSWVDRAAARACANKTKDPPLRVHSFMHFLLVA